MNVPYFLNFAGLIGKIRPAKAKMPEEFAKKHPAAEAVISVTPKEKLLQIVDKAEKYKTDEKVGNCSATAEGILEALKALGVRASYSFKVHGGEGQGDSYANIDHGYKIKRIANGEVAQVEFEGIRLVKEGDSIAIIRHRSTMSWLNECANAIVKCKETRTNDILIEFGGMLLERVKEDDAQLHKREKYKSEFEFQNERALFYTDWCFAALNGTPAIRSQAYYYEPIAKATVDELFRLLDHAETALGAKKTYKINYDAMKALQGFLGEEFAPRLVTLYEKATQFEGNPGKKAKLFMEQLQPCVGSEPNDALCMKALDIIMPDFDRLLFDEGKPQEALDLIKGIFYKTCGDNGYNDYSIGKSSGDPLGRLRQMNSAVVQIAKEKEIELKVNRYHTFSKEPFAVRWAG